MTDTEKLMNMRKVVASSAPYALDLYDQMVKSYNPPPPAPMPKADAVEKP